MTVPEREPTATPSAALQAANERLMALRAAHGHSRPSPQLSSDTAVGKRPVPPAPSPDAHTLAQPITNLPPHLGWESAPVSAHLRHRMGNGHAVVTPSCAHRRHGWRLPKPGQSGKSGSGVVLPGALPSSCLLAKRIRGLTLSVGSEPAVLAPAGFTTIGLSGSQHDMPVEEAVIKLQPSLALAMLRSGQTATGRLWLLLRYLDEHGRGWLELADVRAKLTHKNAPTYLCGQRQLRALLQQGSDLFWQRDKTRVWLSSTAKVAAGLGVGRLQGNPIALPLSVLLEPIGLVRAHLYASFHSSRMGRAGGETAPISRAVLTAVSGVSRRTQHAYERKARVQVQANIAVGPMLSPQAAEETAWHHGRAAFILTDIQGKQGKLGQRYLAWRLPNSYHGPHARLGRGRQRHLNRQLVGLRHYGDAGNGHFDKLSAGYFGRLGAGCLGRDGFWRQRYTANGVMALRCLRRSPGALVYWRGRAERGAGVWYLLSGVEGVG